jgi:hypothetical protein
MHRGKPAGFPGDANSGFFPVQPARGGFYGTDIGTTLPATQDGPGAAIYTPVNAAEWTALGLTAPNSLWLCQEASGNLADSIGAVTATANASPTYENSVANWSRKFLGIAQTANYKFGIGVGTYSAATASQANLQYTKVITANTATRSMQSLGSNVQLRFTTGGILQLVNGGAATSGAYDYRDGAVHPFLLIHNRTASTTTCFTDKETLSVAYTSGTDVLSKGIGLSTNTSPEAQVGYWAHWSGAAAEAVGKATLVSLGWTMAY